MNEDLIITSVQNSKIKLARSLKQKNSRNETNMFLAEGSKIITEAILSGFTAHDIFLQDSKAEKLKGLITLCAKNDIPLTYVNEKVMDALCNTKSPQGAAAIFEKKALKFSSEVINDTRFIVMLEEIQDPGNLGTIIRTCDAVGVDMIILENCTDIYNDKVIRSSMGSVFHIPCYESLLAENINYMKANSWQIACGHLSGENFYSRMQKTKTALIIGNESKGVSKAISDMCTDLWKLPMRGEAESLNASVAAGIMLYEISNRLFSQ
ncbi:MAG: RNA methyltransferase [Clostridia bacterium]|nr:RNA methyltransferase [Clostridia bacterium]